ncbi:MarR family winged helix-turn-helix transcriptional regulator [Sphingomonas hengshuiensis]|uniref:MarR family winged helix-turn-helix transcriptional regulator n=1 Tax=Sphingomonas hengshuiensis TaxID=1609977 RepID=UPI0005CADD62|nr:MarR family transcriptional regulator [Sphingomonas hengshuiensis]
MDREDSVVGDLALRVGYQLRRVDLLSMNALTEDVAKLGVPPGRATALVYIQRNPGGDQAALGRALSINPASAMALVNNLVAQGAVERRAGRDRRSNALHLTDAGQRLHDEVVEAIADHDARFFQTLTTAERAELYRLLVKVREANSATAPRTTPMTRAILRRIK